VPTEPNCLGEGFLSYRCQSHKPSLKKPDQKLVVRANLFGAAAPSRNAGTEGAPTAGTVGINQSGNADPIATRTCELLGNTEIGRKRLRFFSVIRHDWPEPDATG